MGRRKSSKAKKTDPNPPVQPPAPRQEPWSIWRCLILGLAVGWGGVGGTMAIIGYQERDLATAVYQFLRAGILGVPVGLFIGGFAYVSTRATRR